MKMAISLVRTLLYQRWTIAVVISLIILVWELLKHRPDSLNSFTPNFLGEILGLGVVIPLLLGVLLTGVSHVSLTSFKTKTHLANGSSNMATDQQKRILILENESLLGASIEHILKKEGDLNVLGLTPTDGATLVQDIIYARPDILILEEVRYLFDPAKLLFLLQEIPRLRLIVVNAADNLAQIYDKDQILLTRTADLVAVIRHDRNLTLQRVNEE